MPRADRETQRLREHRAGKANWKRWGPYIADRAWGTVREDYSANGDPWTSLTHDMARSKAYRWGEDGIGGLCDEAQILCFGLALWNGKDPILKERFFGLTPLEANHGEDVKELYYYLDSTPTHSYMRMLYKYPQESFPYDQLTQENARRTRNDGEYELLDTGIFDAGRYFDVLIEYAKAGPEEIAIRITATNRGSAAAGLVLLPQLWYRNTWAWQPAATSEPAIELTAHHAGYVELLCTGSSLGIRHLYAMGAPEVLFTCNETDNQRLYHAPNRHPHVKDAFHEYIVHGEQGAISAEPRGTKAGLRYNLSIEPGRTSELRLLLTDRALAEPFAQFDQTFTARMAEADTFHHNIHAPLLTEEERRIQRQALAGMLWTKQFYLYDVHAWLHGDNPDFPPPAQRLDGRNASWNSLFASDVMSMPDKWEYPWFAAWDSAFHAIPLAMVDIDLTKSQLELLINERFMHPNGQVPAYEWHFSDVNPPVQAWAVWRIYNMEKHARQEHGDLQFLERCYHKLLLNFTWWVNRKDRTGRNIFEGGFLGMDNISVFDRSQSLPDGGWIEQADGTGWMALFCLNLMAMGLELAQKDTVYEHLGAKFFEHFLSISAAINAEAPGAVSMWSEQDGWYYDIIHRQHDGTDKAEPLLVRSLVGIVPLFAAQVLEEHWFQNLPHFRERYEWLLANRPEFSGGIACVWTPDGHKCLLSIAHEGRLRRILQRVLDETEFLSTYGLRSISRYHLEHPFVLGCGTDELVVRYEPGESRSGLFGGNSNWRGPIWFPMAFMLITALRVYDRFYGKSFTVECPSGSGRMMNLNEVAMEIGRRLSALFLPDASGRRPMYSNDLQQHDPHFRELLLFPEYFHGDTGKGLGAMHQTGWTGLVAKILDQLAHDRHTSS